MLSIASVQAEDQYFGEDPGQVELLNTEDFESKVSQVLSIGSSSERYRYIELSTGAATMRRFWSLQISGSWSFTRLGAGTARRCVIGRPRTPLSDRGRRPRASSAAANHPPNEP